MTNIADRAADAMSRAHALAQAGDLAGAAAACRSVLTASPAHFYALFMLGSIESQAGRHEIAEQLLARAIALNPRSAEALCAYGDVLLELKRAQAAIDILSKSLKLQPQNVNALIFRGLAFAQSGKGEAALKDFDRAVRLAPQSPFALHNRATVRIQLKQFKDARADTEATLKLDPRHLPARHNLRLVLLKERKFAEALKVIDDTLVLEPDNPESWIARGQALFELRRLAESRAAYENAVALKPDASLAHLGLANLWMEEYRLEEALAACERALAACPEDAANFLLRGNILFHLRRHDEAFRSYDSAVAMKPDYAEAYYHRGSALLALGRYRPGWSDFEHRWEVADCGFEAPRLSAPVWRGEPLAGKSIVVYSEQGLGDTIQFLRFLHVLRRRGARVTFLVHPSLMRLFAPFAPDVELTAAVDTSHRFDFQCALMSLPHGMGWEGVPGDVPYLSPEDASIAGWRGRIGEHGFKVGIAWQGNPVGPIDRGRSIPVAAFAPLASVPGVRLISLQQRHGLDQLERLPVGMTVERLDHVDEGDQAFADTAAIMQCLDLIVVSDSSTAHLAGALARPCWVALKHMPDWRWMLDRSDSPWYPAMRLFRQPAPEDWTSVFSKMSSDLFHVTSKKIK